MEKFSGASCPDRKKKKKGLYEGDCQVVSSRLTLSVAYRSIGGIFLLTLLTFSCRPPAILLAML
jgi:hypothetical protein